MMKTAIAILLFASPALAQTPPPYSLPWQLRPVTVGNVVRSDTSVAFYDGKNAAGDSSTGTTVATSLLATYKVTPRLAPLIRLGFVGNDAPGIDGAPPSGLALVNPVLGVSFAQPGSLRWSLFGALTLPVGMGGGMSPDRGAAEAAARGVAARSAMDNAMFATNYFALIAGAGAAVTRRGFTAQLEATVLQLFRVRGPDSQDDRRTNLTAGLHLGYFVTPKLSFGGELRYQRWLTDVAAVKANSAARETVTFAVGPRLHLELSGKRWLRPGLSYSRALDAPLSSASYQILQLDVPYSF